MVFLRSAAQIAAQNASATLLSTDAGDRLPPESRGPHVRELLEEHGAGEWTREVYARHRGESAEISA
jgi:hypothetical protein